MTVKPFKMYVIYNYPHIYKDYRVTRMQYYLI